MAEDPAQLLREVDERKGVRRIAAHYAALVASSGDAIVSKDLDDVIISWNKGAEQLFGFTSDEAVGHAGNMLFPIEKEPEELQRLLRVREGEIIPPFDTVRRRKNGSLVAVSVSLSPIRSAGGEIVGVSKIARDITDKKKAEGELLAANRDLDEFTYMASHDLQEPVRKQLMFADVLREELGNQLTADARLAMDAISSSAQRMQTMIQDLLALSRAGRQDIELKTLPLDRVADEAVERLSLALAEANATIERDLLPRVTGDETLLVELYQNLVGNAVKFRSPDRPPIVRLTVEWSNGRPIFGVKDNGIGIHPDSLTMIFEPFKRASSRAEYEGSGIGLAVCKKVVRRHGGTLWVESAEGTGAHFRFTLA